MDGTLPIVLVSSLHSDSAVRPMSGSCWRTVVLSLVWERSQLLTCLSLCAVSNRSGGNGAPSFPRATDGKKANMSSMTRILAAHTPALQSRPRVRKRVLWLLPVFVLVNLVFFSRNNNQTPSAEKEGPLKRECCGCYGVIVVLRFQESRGVVPLHEILPSGLFKLLSYFTQ